MQDYLLTHLIQLHLEVFKILIGGSEDFDDQLLILVGELSGLLFQCHFLFESRNRPLSHINVIAHTRNLICACVPHLSRAPWISSTRTRARTHCTSVAVAVSKPERKYGGRLLRDCYKMKTLRCVCVCVGGGGGGGGGDSSQPRRNINL